MENLKIKTFDSSINVSKLSNNGNYIKIQDLDFNESDVLNFLNNDDTINVFNSINKFKKFQNRKLVIEENGNTYFNIMILSYLMLNFSVEESFQIVNFVYEFESNDKIFIDKTSDKFIKTVGDNNVYLRNFNGSKIFVMKKINSNNEFVEYYNLNVKDYLNPEYAIQIDMYGEMPNIKLDEWLSRDMTKRYIKYVSEKLNIPIDELIIKNKDSCYAHYYILTYYFFFALSSEITYIDYLVSVYRIK